MAQDLIGTLKILAVLFACSACVGLAVGFWDAREKGVRAFWLFLSVGGVVAAFQVFRVEYALWVVAAMLAFVAAAVLVIRARR